MLRPGSLPDGLQIDDFFGVQSTLIHGRPTRIQTSTFTVRVDDGAETTARGTFNFHLTVRDQDGQQATQATSITIN